MESTPGTPRALRYSWLAGELREAILNGELEPGCRLPIEVELAALYGVGRSTVREALRVLLAEGLVITVRGMSGGTFVVRPELSNIGERLEVTLRLLSITERVSVTHLVATRAALELPAVRAVAAHHTPEELDRLLTALSPPERAVEVGREFITNRDFHSLILEIAGNPLIAATAEPLFSVLRHRFLRNEAPAAFWENVASDHRRIFDAIADEDANRAADEMTLHLAMLCDNYTLMDTMSNVALVESSRSVPVTSTNRKPTKVR
jgi:GntR family transcriptional repressor for pyruvate dehydrogenase complex